MATAPLTVTVARTTADFIAMAPAWEALHAQAEQPLPFLRHGWLRLSWELRRRPFYDRLGAIMVHEYGNPVMAATFVFTLKRLKPVVQFLGSGTPQYNDALWVRSERTTLHAEALLSALAAEGRLPCTLRALHLPADSPLRVASARRPVSSRGAETASYLDLGTYTGWPDYLDRLSTKLRSDHRRQLSRLEVMGRLAFIIETGDARQQALHWLMATKLDWADRTGHRAKWLEDGSGERFFSKLLDAPDAPQTVVATLRLDGRIVAAVLCLREGPVLYLSKIAHDPSFATYSPGRTLVMFLIELAFAEGIALLDLMIGTTEWKRRFATEHKAIVTERVRLR